MNIYVSTSSNFNAYSLFVQPYHEGANNFKEAFAESTPLAQRIKHFVAGVGLMIPLLNTILMIALRCFCTHTPAPDQAERLVKFDKARVRQYDRTAAPQAVGEQHSIVSSISSESRERSGFARLFPSLFS